MSNPLVGGAVVALVAAAVVLLRSRKSEATPKRPLHGAETGSHRDYPREREDARVAIMSADGRAWEAASLQRNRDMSHRVGSPEGRAQRSLP